MAFFSILGLALIVAGWAIQLNSVLKEYKTLNKYFLILYIAGVVFLLIGNKNSGLDFIAILNIFSAILATVTLIKLK